MEDLTGVTIGRYKIISQLGSGGMAVVYRAIDTLLDRNVAIKMIIPEISNKEKLLKRFNREAKTLASLSHPNIVKVLDYGEYEETPYLVMEYISGGTLKSGLGKPINFSDAAALLAPVAHALQYAHQQKIVHRDIKPENILLNDSGQAMLSDFGILKLVEAEESQGLTGTGKIVGTPAYMSPEQIRGKEVDGRADIYSLGIVFFEMLTGKKPYSANTPIELSMKHLHDPIPKARQFVRDLPAEAEQVIVRSMAKSADDRYQTMNAFAQALEKLSGSTSRITSERKALTPAEEREAISDKQKRSYALIGIVAAVLVLAGTGIALFGQRLAPPPVTETLQTSAPNTPTPTDAFTAVAVTATLTPPISTPTDFVFQTATQPLTPRTVLSPSNISQIVDINRIDGISVKKMDWIETGNWLIDAGSGEISFIDPEAGSISQRINLAGEIPLAMTISQSTNRLFLLVGSTIRVFDIQTFEQVTSYSVTGGSQSIAASPDGQLIALGITDNKVQLVNAEDGRVMRTLRSNYGGWSVAFSPDSSIVVGGTSQGILMWEAGTGLWLPSTGAESNSIKNLIFSNDGTLLAGGTRGAIQFWNVADGNALYQANANFGEVHSLDFSPDDSMLVSGTDDGIIRFWDPRSANLLHELNRHTSGVYGVCFSPGGHNLASGANEGTILIWGIP